MLDVNVARLSELSVYLLDVARLSGVLLFYSIFAVVIGLAIPFIIGTPLLRNVITSEGCLCPVFHYCPSVV